MSDELNWGNILPDIESAEKFRRGHGGKYDREVAMLTAAFARHRQAARTEALRQGIRMGLEAAAEALCPGEHHPACDIWPGGLGHCTCAYNAYENEDQIKAIRALDPDSIAKVDI